MSKIVCRSSPYSPYLTLSTFLGKISIHPYICSSFMQFSELTSILSRYFNSIFNPLNRSPIKCFFPFSLFHSPNSIFLRKRAQRHVLTDECVGFALLSLVHVAVVEVQELIWATSVHRMTERSWDDLSVFRSDALKAGASEFHSVLS